MHNPYNTTLNEITDQNTNPKRGQEAFTGANPISGDNNWGQSQVDLAAAGVAPGDTIRLRWDFGQDGCNGNDGWYVDRIEVFTCSGVEPPPPPNQECKVYDGTSPTPILDTMTTTSTATVSDEANPVSDVHVRNLEGVHTYMGDVLFKLISPMGTEVTLFDDANCAGADGISAEFDDDAANVIGCNDWESGGSYRPFEPLAAFAGENANGNWTLSITDRAVQDSGVLQSWPLELCRDLPPPPPPGDEDVNKATGGGWLADSGGNKINFGFNAKQKDAGFEGELQLNDKSAGAKIHLKTVTSLGPVQGQCGAITDSPRALEFNGTGKYNQIDGVSFRVCVEDNGEGGSATPDRFHLQCTAGCSYNLASRVANEDVDGGNIQAHRVNSPPPANPAPANQPATLILNPVLMTEGLIGAAQVYEVNVYGGNQQPLAGQTVSLTSVSATGATQTLTALANLAGKALFTVPVATKATEYRAQSGNVGSNAVHVTPVLRLR